MADPDSAEHCVLRVREVAKAFSGIQALSGVSFDLRQGEIDGTSYAALSPEQARHLGVGVVYQEFNLLPELSVAENIFLGDQPTGWLGLLDAGHRHRRTLSLLNRLGAHLDPDRLVKHLTVGEQQIVEIAKALAMDVRVLIMDEPSAVLPSHDMERLYGVIRALRAEGASIIYISHRLEEIFLIADRVTVLKDGRSVMTKPVAETTRAELVNSMVGRQLTEQFPPADAAP